MFSTDSEGLLIPECWCERCGINTVPGSGDSTAGHEPLFCPPLQGRSVLDGKNVNRKNKYPPGQQSSRSYISRNLWLFALYTFRMTFHIENLLISLTTLNVPTDVSKRQWRYYEGLLFAAFYPKHVYRSPATWTDFFLWQVLKHIKEVISRLQHAMHWISCLNTNRKNHYFLISCTIYSVTLNGDKIFITNRLLLTI